MSCLKISSEQINYVGIDSPDFPKYGISGYTNALDQVTSSCKHLTYEHSHWDHLFVILAFKHLNCEHSPY